MKTMKLFRYILMAAATVIAVAACQEEPYSPGELDRLDCQGVFFPQEQATDYIVAPDDDNYLTFSIERAQIKYEAEVPYEISMSEEGFFELEDEIIYFDEDQEEAEFKVFFSEDFEVGKKYTCTIKVTDPRYVSNYSLSSNELTFTLTVVEWTLLGEGQWRDDLFSSYGAIVGAVLKNPYAEKAVKVYERSDLPGYYRVDEVYTPEYVATIANGDAEAAEEFEEFCPGETIYINASNPDKVIVDWQYLFDEMTVGYGPIYACSDCEECFEAGYSNIYGTLKDGCITFPKNSLILYMPTITGAFPANTSGKQRLVLPGYVGFDYSIELKYEPAENGVLPVEFVFGADVKKVNYKVFDGHLSDVDMVAKLDEVKSGKNVKTVTAAGVYDFTAEKSGFYTLIACTYDKAGEFKEHAYIKFGYDTVDDPKEVDIHMGLIVSDKYGGAGNTKENSMEFYLYGKDIVDAKVAIYKQANYDDFKSSMDSLVQYYMPSLEPAQLKALNGEGYNGVVGGLAAGVEYTMIAYLDNGYHSGIFTTSASTEGTYNPLDEQFQFYDLPKELQAVEQEDYFKEWQVWSVDPFEPGDWNRKNRGTVSFAEGEDLYFNIDGKPVAGPNNADPSKTMEVISLSGMFPEIKEKYDLESDAIDFHYYEGYIYTLMTEFGKVKVDGDDAYPTTAYMYYYGGEFRPFLENFAMLGGFVRNPVDKESRDIIAFVGNPSASAEYLAMCLCWFEDSKYESSGYLFEEEGHLYPILINPESKYVQAEAGELTQTDLPASYSIISKELQKGQTNCVETAHGFVMSTIDRFKGMPYDYMQNILDVKVSASATEFNGFTMTKSSRTSLASDPEKLEMVFSFIR